VSTRNARPSSEDYWNATDIEHLIVHEVRAPVLIRSGGRCWPPALQADAFAAFDLHAQLQSLQPVQAVDALLANGPTLALEHDQHAQVAESWTVHRDLPHAQAQRTLITCLALRIPDRRPQQRQTA